MMDMWVDLVSTQIFSVVMDAVLLVVLVAMWVLWWKQSQRTQRVEAGLLEAAAQLQEASALLDDALSQISLLQRQEQVKSMTSNENKPSSVASKSTAEDGIDDDIEPHFSAQAHERLNAQTNNLKVTNYAMPTKTMEAPKVVPEAKQGVMDVAKILRMQREGASLDSIADTLNMPLAQVKLMLMLQKGA